MRIEGYTVEDNDGHGVQGVIPFPGLTVMIGRNGSGKTRFLETLASMLDRSNSWLGRHGRVQDESYAYGFLYLSGDWGGADWAWLQDVIAEQDEDSDCMAWPAGSRLPTWDEEITSLDGLLQQVVTFFAGDAPGVCERLVSVVETLFRKMLVSYQPHELATIDIVIDTRDVDSDLAGQIMGLCASLPNSRAREALMDVAAGAHRYVHLFHIGTLDEPIFADYRLEPPTVISVGDGVPDGESAVVATLNLLCTNLGPHPWLVADGHRFSVDSKITGWIAQLRQRMRDLAPPFLLELGAPEIYIPVPELWSVQPQLLLGLRNSRGGSFMDSAELSAGTRRWLNLLAVLAANDLLRERAEERPDSEAVLWIDSAPTLIRTRNRRLAGTVLLIDEPEVHLHQVAQGQVAEWLTARADAGFSVGVATHAPAIIDVRSLRAAIVSTTRRKDDTIVADISDSVLTAVDQEAESIGLDRSAWLQVAGALLVVEGSHDVAVLRRLYGNVLSDRRIRTIPVRGHKNLTDGTVIVEFFASLGRPVRVMLDDVRARAVETGDTVALPTSEERVVDQLIRHRKRFPNLTVVPYADPDIICAMPMAAVRRAYPGYESVSWAEIIESWRSQANPTGFKAYALKRLHIRDTADDFVEKVLLATRPGERPSSQLQQAIDALIGSLN